MVGDRLSPEIGFSGAIVAVSVTAITTPPFRLRDIAPWGTGVIVVIHALINWLLYLIDGIEIRYFSHGATLKGRLFISISRHRVVKRIQSELSIVCACG
jgi:hypothetical protein